MKLWNGWGTIILVTRGRGALGSAFDVAAAADLVFAASDAGDGFGVGDVLFGEDADGEGGCVVGFEDGDGALQDDDALVEVFVDEVDGAAGYFDAVVEGLGLSVEAGEGGKQRGMDVEDAIGEGGDELGRKQAHVAGEDDEVDLGFEEGGDHVEVVLGAGSALRSENFRCEPQLGGAFDSRSIRDVGKDEGDLGVDLSGSDGVGDGEEVGAASGEKDAEAERA